MGESAGTLYEVLPSCYNLMSLSPQVLVLKVGVLNVGFKPFVPRGAAWGLEFPPLSHQTRGEVCGEIVSVSPTHWIWVFFLFA